MKLKFRTYSAHPSYGTVLPGRTADVPDHLVKDLIDGGYAEDPNPRPVEKLPMQEESGPDAPGESIKEAAVHERAADEPDPQESVKEAAALFGGEAAMQSPANPRRRGKTE